MRKQFSDIAKSLEDRKKELEVLPTGFKEVDKYLEGGFLKKELVVLGGGTGKGKSLMAGTIFNNIARKGFNCAYFSLEIANEMIASRLIGAKANISPARVMITQLMDQEEKEKEKARANIAAYDEFMYFYDDLYKYEEIEKEIKAHTYDFVVIDFIQNIMTSNADEYERLSYVSLSLQKLAKSQNTCILALSQLSNQMSRDKKNKDVVEYKGSGSIGTVCDLGFFIEDSGMENAATLKLRKNRRGVSGKQFDFIIKTPGGLVFDYEPNYLNF